MKKLILALVALVAFAGAANAQTITGPIDTTITMYGASAQIKFWDALAEDFLLAPVAVNGLECTGAVAERRDESVSDLFDDNRGTCAEGCTVDGVGGQTVCIKYSEIASFFGVEAVAIGDTNAPARGCPNANERLLLDDACFTTAESAANFDTVCVLTCQTVHLGASDVNFEAFVQRTIGYQDGYVEPGSSDDDGWQDAGSPLTPGGDYDTSIEIPELGQDPGVSDAFTTNIVPFGIFVNTDLTEGRCEATSSVVANSEFIQHSPVNKRCGAQSDCIAYYQCRSGVCKDENGVDIAGSTCGNHADCKVFDGGQLTGTQSGDWACTTRAMESLTQLEMQLAFADNAFNGNVLFWNDLGLGLPTRGIGRCMRHAGSGTHATFDFTVTRTYAFESTTTPFQFWHYASSSDLDDCIENNAYTGIEFGLPLASQPIAIGYLDADKVLNSTLRNVRLIGLDGMLPEKENIVDGRYPFWAEQVIYVLESVTDGTLADVQFIREEMELFAGDAANLAANGNRLGETLRFWATFGEMNVTRNLDIRTPIVGK
jgi:hypothetical protein